MIFAGATWHMKNSIAVLFGLAAGVLSAMAVSSLTQPGNDPKARRRRRHASDLVNLPRSAALSHLYLAAEQVAPPNYPPESKFSPAALWDWLRNYLAYVLRKKHFFPPYTASPQHAMYNLLDENGADTVRIALAGDWGTGTDEADCVATQMKAFHPHFTIHIGDVYYVGDAPSVNENCLGIRNSDDNYDPVTWPLGSLGSFALNGNHEMYANGGGYFDVLLPELGLSNGATTLGQQTSFFCLQNNYWRIIAIDTAYYGNGLPILGQIPLINKIPGVGGNCKLHPSLMDWLTNIVGLHQQDNRGVIILSHHQYYSAFEDQFPKPAQQLWNAGLQRPILWFWGHEHRLAGYDLYGTGQLQAFGRCVGHGGMPLAPEAPKKSPAPTFYDKRPGPKNFGVNGHVNLEFKGPNLTATYVDLDGTKILRESWLADGTGAVKFITGVKLITDTNFHP
jgi:hypothetical protein